MILDGGLCMIDSSDLFFDLRGDILRLRISG